MAAAYATLVSLSNDLELIQNHPLHSFSFENKQIQSLLQIVNFLIEFMDSYDNSHGHIRKAAQLLEMSIARAARAAEEVIESHVVNQIGSGSTLDGKRRSRFMLDVQKAIEQMEFVRRKAVNIAKSLKQPTHQLADSSSTPLTPDKNSVVGLDDALLQLLDLLNGYPSGLRVIPVVGTGDIVDWNADSSSFPVLERLVIEGSRELEEMPWGIGDIPTLQCIRLKDCSDELMISTARMVKEMQEEGNEDLKLEFHMLGRSWDCEQSLRKKLGEEDLITITNLSFLEPIVIRPNVKKTIDTRLRRPRMRRE